MFDYSKPYVTLSRQEMEDYLTGVLRSGGTLHYTVDPRDNSITILPVRQKTDFVSLELRALASPTRGDVIYLLKLYNMHNTSKDDLVNRVARYVPVTISREYVADCYDELYSSRL